MSRICPLNGEKVIYLTCQECDDRKGCSSQEGKMDNTPCTEKQMSKMLPASEARTLLVDLMHEGYDTICSPVDEKGNLTVTWPASINIGKQLDERK